MWDCLHPVQGSQGLVRMPDGQQDQTFRRRRRVVYSVRFDGSEDSVVTRGGDRSISCSSFRSCVKTNASSFHVPSTLTLVSTKSG